MDSEIYELNLPDIPDGDEIIKTLRWFYQLALAQGYVRNPTAWALYKTWQKFDQVPRKGEKTQKGETDET